MKRKYYEGSIYSWDKWLELKSQGYTDVLGDVDFGDQGLTSLEGSPITCHDFWCHDNKLTSLEGAPRETLDFFCHHNNLTSLKGAPHKTNKFWCQFNELSSLDYHPKILSSINASNNPLDKTDPYVIMLLLQEKLVL